MITEWIDQLSTDFDISDNTRRTYAHAARKFAAWAGDVTEFTAQDVERYKRHLLRTGKRTSAAAHLSAIRQMFAWAEAHEMHPNVAASVKVKVKTQKDRPHRWDRLTDDETRRLVDSLSDAPANERLIVLLKLVGGLRDCSIARARKEHVVERDGRLVLEYSGKGDHADDTPHMVVLDANPTLRQAWNEFEAAAERDEDDAYLSPHIFSLHPGSVGRIVRRCLDRAGIDRKNVVGHSLRHTAATKAIESGADMDDVRQFLGHADARTTARYNHASKRLSNPIEAMIDV